MPGHQVAAAVGMNLSALSRHGALVVLLVFYSALLVIQLDHGLASGDAHGIVRSTQALVNGGHLEVSRPPGHPTTEFYLFGATGWILLKGFGVKFGNQVFLIWQGVAALTTLIVFYELLYRLAANRVRLVAGPSLCSRQLFFRSIACLIRNLVGSMGSPASDWQE
ncbi:MAG: hypothetical protein DMF45_03360 [Verrucomicrobia bacterium]|nr:MAG: hypothetical protein DMF45_03360 [Verrucomicrobiota bacterium]